MTQVCVIFGGQNSEHEVSLRSATCILENLDQKKYGITMVGITKGGQWYHYTGPVALIVTGQWEVSPYLEPAMISPDPSEGGLILLGERPSISTRVRRQLFQGENLPQEHQGKNLPRILPLDVVFPVLHGKNGEDGTIQGLLDLAGIPYVGCGLRASVNCMDKEIMHILLTHAGVAKTDLVAFRKNDPALDNLEELARELEQKLDFPMFVKPANAGSSVGISKVKEPAQLEAAIAAAFAHDNKIVIERTLVGREIECAVWGNENPNASHALGEIVPTREFYDYDGKYTDDSAGLIAPAELPEETVEAVRAMAVKAYQTMECTGLARVDFFVQHDGTPVLNEINTMPGFTSISMFPRLFLEDGLPIAQLVDHLIDSAFSLTETPS